MTKRNKTSEQLSAYLDGELSPAETAALETALANEPALARELEGLRATRALVRRLPQERAPDDFARRVVARLERQSLLEPGLHQGPSPSRRRLWLAAAAAAVFLAAGIATYVALLVFPPHGTNSVAHAPQPPALDQPLAMGKARDALSRETPPDVADRGRRTEVETPAAPLVTKGGGGPAPAKPGGLDAKQARPPEAETLYVPVNAGDLTLARRGLEKALFDMEIAPTTEESAASAGRASNLVYRTVEAAPGQVKYVVANVSRSQLPVLVRKLEEFRRKQDQRQDSLESAQTRLAMVETPLEPNGPREVSQAAVLDRGAFLRQVLAESERAEKPAPGSAKAGDGKIGGSIASAEPAGRDKTIISNAEYAQKARDFHGISRAGPGAYDEAAKAPKSSAPGEPSLNAPAGKMMEEQDKKAGPAETGGVGSKTGLPVAPADSANKEAAPAPGAAKGDLAQPVLPPTPPPASAPRKSEEDKSAQFQVGAGIATRDGLVAKDKAWANSSPVESGPPKGQAAEARPEALAGITQSAASRPAQAGNADREREAQAQPGQVVGKADLKASGEGRGRIVQAHRSDEARYNLCIILNAPAPAHDAKGDPSDSQPMDDKDEDPPAQP